MWPGLSRGHVPYVDPDQGGVEAWELMWMLLDHLSVKAEEGTGSGLQNPDNGDRSTRNCRAAYARHGGVELYVAKGWSAVIERQTTPGSEAPRSMAPIVVSLALCARRSNAT